MHMEEQIKKLELREDGFIEVTLKRVKDFDDYVFAQIAKDVRCLACIRDPKSKLKVFYDRKGYLDVLTYLQGHMFEREELLEFLIYLFEHMIQANTQKPVCLQSDLVFLSYDGGVLKFLALPLTMDKWVFQSEQSKQFLKELIIEIRTKDGYECIGLLVEMAKEEEVAFPLLLQGLLHLQQQHQRKLPWYKKWIRQKEKEVYQVQGLPKPIPVLEQPVEECLDMETMVLFGMDQTLCFVDQRQKQCFPILNEVYQIGRSNVNHLCINDSFISAHHATFYKATARLKDHDSSNGTFVNGERITEVTLVHGDIVSFANHEFRYQERME